MVTDSMHICYLYIDVQPKRITVVNAVPDTDLSSFGGECTFTQLNLMRRQEIRW